MSKRKLEIVLKDIIDEIKRIKKFTEKIENFIEFKENELVFYAVLKSLENIGEAVKQIPEENKKLYSLDWKKISGLRDILIHHYFGIDVEIIWDVVKNKIPELEKEINHMLKDLLCK